MATFFNGAARAALPVFVGDRPGAAWFHLGEAKVAFDFTVVDGSVRRITFRAEPEVLAERRAPRRGADRPPVDTERRGHTCRPRSSDRRTRHTPGTQERRHDEDHDLPRTSEAPATWAITGESADDVIKAQDRHLKEAEKAGDATHQDARDAMKGRWRHPKKSMDWYARRSRPSPLCPRSDPATVAP